MDTTGEKEKRTSKENVDGRSTSSHDNKKFRTRSVEKERGMAFGFQKTATGVINPNRQKRDEAVPLDAIKAHGEVGAKLHPFLTSALDGSGSSPSCGACFTP